MFTDTLHTCFQEHLPELEGCETPVPVMGLTSGEELSRGRTRRPGDERDWGAAACKRQ